MAKIKKPRTKPRPAKKPDAEPALTTARLRTMFKASWSNLHNGNSGAENLQPAPPFSKENQPKGKRGRPPGSVSIVTKKIKDSMLEAATL